MKCGWRSQQCITPKKAIQPILGNRKERIQASGLGHKKNYAPEKLPPGRSPPLSIQRPQPRLSQLSPLPQKGCKADHGGERVRVIRTEVRFAPCKSSAVEGLRLASQRCRRCHTFIQHAPIYAIGIPLEIRPERMGAPKCRVPSLPPYKMVWGHLQNGSTHGGCCLQNGGTRVLHLPTNIKYFGLT